MIESLAKYDSVKEYEHYRILPDGIFLAVYRTLYGNGRLVISKDRYDMGIAGSWCYPSMFDAIAAMNEWASPALDGYTPTTRPPDGWFREVHTGWRRKDGDPAQEYFQA